MIQIRSCLAPKFQKNAVTAQKYYIQPLCNDIKLTDFFCAVLLIKSIALTNLALLVACLKAKAHACGHGHSNSSSQISCWLNLTRLTRAIGTRANVTVRIHSRLLKLFNVTNTIISTEGRGEFVSATGHSYDGEWRNDMRHGQGEYRLSDGIVYSGELFNDNLLVLRVANTGV